MTPQSSFMVLAPIETGREAELHALLASMNRSPGNVDPHNALVPFAEYEGLHFARLFVMDDQTLGDVAVYGLTPAAPAKYLAFLGDVDGDAGPLLAEMARRSEPGLRAIFSCCADFAPGTDLLIWMRAHDVPAASNYVNWRGRTVRRVREEAALRDAVERYVDANRASLATAPPAELHAALQRFVLDERAAGRLVLTPESPTPLGRRIGDLLHLVGVPLLLLVLFLPLAVAAAIVLLRIRMLERTDPEICPRPDPRRVERLAALEDHDVTNQFTAMGTLKPGLARRWACVAILWLLEYTLRHVFTRGRLGRVRTIHFARWTFVDGKRRLLFTSSYDGSLDSYMDDFVNKVAFGLNVVFSNGIGYPRARWLVLDGAKNELRYKYYIRRHQLETNVWYSAHPGLSAFDLERNGMLRATLDAPSLPPGQEREWLSLL